MGWMAEVVRLSTVGVLGDAVSVGRYVRYVRYIVAEQWAVCAEISRRIFDNDEEGG